MCQLCRTVKCSRRYFMTWCDVTSSKRVHTSSDLFHRCWFSAWKSKTAARLVRGNLERKHEQFVRLKALENICAIFTQLHQKVTQDLFFFFQGVQAHDSKPSASDRSLCARWCFLSLLHFLRQAHFEVGVCAAVGVNVTYLDRSKALPYFFYHISFDCYQYNWCDQNVNIDFYFFTLMHILSSLHLFFKESLHLKSKVYFLSPNRIIKKKKNILSVVTPNSPITCPPCTKWRAGKSSCTEKIATFERTVNFVTPPVYQVNIITKTKN